jgi:hypothetical protein
VSTRPAITLRREGSDGREDVVVRERAVSNEAERSSVADMV